MTEAVRHIAGRGEVNSNHVWTDAVDSQLCIWTAFSDQSDVLNIYKLPQKQCFLACRECFLPVGRLQVERCLLVINLKWLAKNTDSSGHYCWNGENTQKYRPPMCLQIRREKFQIIANIVAKVFLACCYAVRVVPYWTNKPSSNQQGHQTHPISGENS